MVSTTYLVFVHTDVGLKHPSAGAISVGDINSFVYCRWQPSRILWGMLLGGVEYCESYQVPLALNRFYLHLPGSITR